MSSTRKIEDQYLLAALESLTRDPLAPEVLRSVEKREAERLVAELLCALPAALDPIAPSAGAKRRLLERVGNERPVARSPIHTEKEAQPGAAAQSIRRRRRLQGLAAAFAVVTLGSLLLSGWLLSLSRHQRFAIAQVHGELATTSGRLLALVLSPGAELCRLRPVGTQPPQPHASGNLFATPSGDFYLTVAHLQPPGEGLRYTVWFMNESSVLGRMEVPVGAREPLQMFSREAPRNFSAVLLTLESQVGSSEPKGPVILYGNEMERLL